MQSSYSKETLYKIGHENYNKLSRLSFLLLEGGYWETPQSVIHKSIEEVLALYVQAVCVSLSLSCRLYHEEDIRFILDIVKRDMLGIEDGDMLTESMKEAADRIVNSPPILLQLCNLYDLEKKDCIAASFLDALFNILLALTDLCQARNRDTASYLMAYYKKVNVFYNSGDSFIYRMGEREVFRKINSEEFGTAPLFLRTSHRMAGEEGTLNESTHGKESHKGKRKQEGKTAEQEESAVPEADFETEKDGLEELLSELNALIGLNRVKEEINSLINLIKVKKIREEYGMPAMNVSYHMVYTGNPGTGKTTVARLVAAIYKELGILSKGNLVETDRSGLVAGYVGQTALKVKEVVEEALGGVLFIDEAYSLAGDNLPGDFGKEAIDALVKLMEDNRDNLVVIVAGYKEEMKAFLKSNTGLISRFNRFIEFPDYTEKELTDILLSMADRAGLTVEEEAKMHITKYLSRMGTEKAKEFGNARGIRNIFEKILINQANRLAACDKPTKEQVSVIHLTDVRDI
ncbi:AAA family ATPase [Anaerocolumna xylanovorans]|uniref:ATPase family associated with various cellular activities (AAA) n=1 Tax=Anaerocolumna xylanovorans DSM 12503 TaxID=1121345 RepID=A0A1M7YCN1_9FIRM|nr:AAA family ATPase [Anaerocolumna xylanovorans]SHO50326.1 ATPase family associated with various cellular activities (AAA) [Anaerocolumna xylanovorans DSM 12503]